VIDILDDEDGFVQEILPRRNSFVRPAVANIEMFVATVATRKPKPHMDVLDRFLISAEAAHAEAIVCVNKIDLGSADGICGIYGGIYETIPVSAVTGEGIEELKKKLSGLKVAFSGPSGVGKSSIINSLLGHEVSATGGISGKTGRGKHTTRHIEIFETNFGAALFDTPGYTSYESSEMDARELGDCFPEFAGLKTGCRFEDCLHTDEPNCAVRDAAGRGEVPESRYGTYLRVLGEISGKKRKGSGN
jgi:ribosome biogenesis GTPase